MLFGVVVEAEKYLDPLRNIYLLRIRERLLVALEKEISVHPDDKNLGAKYRNVAERILSSYEYYGYLHHHRLLLCFKMAESYAKIDDRPRALK